MSDAAEVIINMPSIVGSVGSLIGLFTDVATHLGGLGVTIPTTISLVGTSGYSTMDMGAAVYVYDASVDSTYVTAHPKSSFLAVNGRGFRLSLEQDITPEMLSAGGSGLTDDSAAFQAAIDLLPSSGGEITVLGGIYKLLTEPTWPGKTINWDISPAATFTGAGTGVGRFPGTARQYDVGLRADLTSGGQVTITTTSGTAAAKVGEHIIATNSVATGMYSVRFAFLNKTADIGDQSNDVADTLVSRWNSLTYGSAWGRWDLVSSPLNPSSGLPGAPGAAQRFSIVLGEGNPQNRHADPTWEGETRALGNGVGGYQMVPETQDFSSLLGTGIRRGYKVSFGYLVSRSAYTNDDQQRHALFQIGYLGNPNTIASGGAFLFATGYKQFVTAVAISAAGAGYVAGDLLTFNSGLAAVTNQDAVVRVKTVNGSGAITAAEVYVSGFYTAGFATPVGVTGGTGTGATFTYTLSSNTAERPQAFAGMAGEWKYGIDACFPNGTNSHLGYAIFGVAMFRAPNNQMIAVARNAGDTADIGFNKLNASNEWELSQAGTPVRAMDALTSKSPTGGVGYSAGAGAAVVQATNKGTGVTLNNACGQITLNNAALAANTVVTFALTNSVIAADDEVRVWLKGGNATGGTYRVVAEGNASGSRIIVVENKTAGSLSEALILGFAVYKAAIS